MRGLLKIYLFVQLYFVNKLYISINICIYTYVHNVHMMNRIRQMRGRIQDMSFERLETYSRVNMRRCCT